MSVAAAIGVCSDGIPDNMPNQRRTLANRLANKMNLDFKRQTGSPSGLVEINKSIEKMSISSNVNDMGLSTYNSRPTCQMPLGTQTMMICSPNRKDSGWTTSTEGYESMKSNQSSRRCSNLSNISQVG